MYNQDYLQKVIEDFFTVIRKLIRTEITLKNQDFKSDDEFNDVVFKFLNINSNEIDNLNREKYKSILFNDKYNLESAYFFLKIAKYYYDINDELYKKYLDLGNEILNVDRKVFKLDDELIKNEINVILNHINHNYK